MDNQLTKFTIEQIRQVRDSLNETNYLDERPRFRKKIITSIDCPICEKELILYLCGNSLELKCPEDGIAFSIHGL